MAGTDRHHAGLPMERRLNMDAIESFHGFLRSYMALQEELIERMQTGGQYIYTYSLRYPGGYGFEDIRQYFSDYSDCFSAMKADGSEEKAVFARIEKLPLRVRGEDGRTYPPAATMDFNSAFETMDIHSSEHCTEEEGHLDMTFAGMWFSFPTPFRRGNIVWIRSRYGDGEPFVLDELCTWRREEMVQNGFPATSPLVARADRTVKRLRDKGDSFDMSCRGYFLTQEECIYCDHANGCYQNLEWYPEPLEGVDRLLKPVSAYLKEKASGEDGDMELLLNAFRQLLLREQYEKTERLTQGLYVQEALLQYGLPKKPDTASNY